MDVKFKPRFLKDLSPLKSDKELIFSLGKIIQQIEKARNISEIGNLKKLESFESRYRIKIYFDKKRDYRVGMYIKGKTVWFARLLHRRKIYNENW